MSKGWNYKPADWWIICDVCSKKIKATNAKHRWDGLIVCDPCFEHRHSQDYLKVRPDKITVPFLRPRPEDVFTFVCNEVTSQGEADYGTADCAMADIDYGYRFVCTWEGKSSVAGYAVAGCSITNNLLEGYL